MRTLKTVPAKAAPAKAAPVMVAPVKAVQRRVPMKGYQ